MKEITIWLRLNPSSTRWEHNHIAAGFSDAASAPEAINDLQRRSWKGAGWGKIKGNLDGNLVIPDPKMLKFYEEINNLLRQPADQYEYMSLEEVLSNSAIPSADSFNECGGSDEGLLIAYFSFDSGGDFILSMSLNEECKPSERVSFDDSFFLEGSQAKEMCELLDKVKLRQSESSEVVSKICDFQRALREA